MRHSLLTVSQDDVLGTDYKVINLKNRA